MVILDISGDTLSPDHPFVPNTRIAIISAKTHP